MQKDIKRETSTVLKAYLLSDENNLYQYQHSNEIIANEIRYSGRIWGEEYIKKGIRYWYGMI